MVIAGGFLWDRGGVRCLGFGGVRSRVVGFLSFGVGGDLVSVLCGFLESLGVGLWLGFGVVCCGVSYSLSAVCADQVVCVSLLDRGVGGAGLWPCGRAAGGSCDRVLVYICLAFGGVQRCVSARYVATLFLLGCCFVLSLGLGAGCGKVGLVGWVVCWIWVCGLAAWGALVWRLVARCEVGWMFLESVFWVSDCGASPI